MSSFLVINGNTRQQKRVLYENKKNQDMMVSKNIYINEENNVLMLGDFSV